MLFTLLLLVIFLVCILLNKAYRTLSIKELRRRARSSKNKNIGSIYRIAAFGESLRLLLWLFGGFSVAILFLRTANYNSWLAVGLVLVAGWLIVEQKPLKIDGILWKLAAFIARPVAYILNFLQPLLSRLTRWLKGLQPIRLHTGLYNKEDLLELLQNQEKQIDNRIPAEDLQIALGGLTFGDKIVSAVMTPRRQLKLVAASDAIGPLLMDELHASGFSRFPVVKEPTKAANPEIVGTLYFKDLIDHEDKGKVHDVMKKQVYYINETQNLHQALKAFLSTQHHLLIVVNNFEEIVGIITLEDVIEQIMGQEIIDEFDRYSDIRTVAEIYAKREQHKHLASEVVE